VVGHLSELVGLAVSMFEEVEMIGRHGKKVVVLAALAAGAAVWAGAARAGAPGLCYDPGTRDGYVCPPCGCSGDRLASAERGKCKLCQTDLVARKDLKHVAIVLFEGVELLDFSGPGEVFAASGDFYIYTVSRDGKPLTSQGFVRVDPEYSLHDCPWPDVLVVPGGSTGNLVADRTMMEWIQIVGKQADQVLSVGSGAFVLAKAGLLDGLEATTHAADLDELRREAPRTKVRAGVRFVDNGKVVTTAGVSAGIDGALHVVGKLCGADKAKTAAARLQYEPGAVPAGTVVTQLPGKTQ
jgi:putative intracellular protease/amidase